MPAHDPRAGTRAARHRRARDRLRDQEARDRLRVSRHQPPAGSVPARTLPDDPRALPRIRHRHRERADSRRAGHTTCGGVVTDLAGRTDLAGLYAVGETSHTGPRREPAREQLAARMPRDRAAAEAIEAAGFDAETPATLPAWDKPCVGCGRGSRRCAQLGRAAPPDVEPSASCVPTSASNARSTGCRCCATRSRSTTRTSA